MKNRTFEEKLKLARTIREKRDEGMSNKEIATFLGLRYNQLMGWMYANQNMLYGPLDMPSQENRYMSDQEICDLYRNAKDQKQQISILAQLNDIRKKDVIVILRNGGYTI